MIELRDIVTLSSGLCADLLRAAQDQVTGGKPQELNTADEAEAVVMVSLCAAALVEGAAILALPSDKAANVRAFVERLARDIQVVKNLNAAPPQEGPPNV